MKVEVAASWAPVPNKPTVSVDVKQRFSFRDVHLDFHTAPELWCFCVAARLEK